MSTNTARGYRVGVVSLGCSKNRVDTERMLGYLRMAGHTVVNNAAEAEIIIINTCGFIESAKQESIDTILEYAQYKQSGSCIQLIVSGCLSERYRDALVQELPEVDVFIGIHEYERLPGLLKGMRDIAPPPGLQPRVLTTPPYSAYLRIADGCNNRCAYCAIPLIRGPQNSVPLPVLLEEAKSLLTGGVHELTLIAQDTSGYGTDLYGKPMLLPLMRQLTQLEGLHWLRVLYTYPDTVTPELVAGIAENKKICNYLDIPLQHIHDEILSRMNRRGNHSHIEKTLRYIRQYAPDFILRTTMMVGFPGETDAHFQEMLAFLQEYPFDRLGAFAFSPEEDTAAADMPRQVPEEIKAHRLDTLMRRQQDISYSRNQSRIGSEVEMLIEHTQGNDTLGRSYAEAPEVDGNIRIPHAARHLAGSYTRVRIVGAAQYDLTGEEIL